jgi:hypothetical protein
MPVYKPIKKLDVMEIEYHELSSIFKIFKNFKFGLRVRTTPETYEEDWKNLVIEVKTRLNDIIGMSKKAHDGDKDGNK